jgi:hypothetical protein
VSYVAIPQSVYQQRVPGTPTAEVSPGWLSSPFPSWGANPLLAGERRIAVGEDAPPVDPNEQAADQIVSASSEAVDTAAQAAETAVLGIPRSSWLLLGIIGAAIVGGSALMLRE